MNTKVFCALGALIFGLWLSSVGAANAQVSAPVFSPPSGTWATPQNITITATGATAIYYTTDGSEPTSASRQYTAPILVGSSIVLNAVAVSGTTSSAVTTGTYSVSGNISAGNLHVMALTFGGYAYGWGSNDYGQLGDGGTKSAQDTPVEVTSTNTYGNVIAVDAGAFHTLFLTYRGNVWATGDNGYGQLGNAGTGQKNSPVEVLSAATDVALSNIVEIGAGGDSSVALMLSGSTYSVWTWGYNADGEGGIGQITSPYYGRANQVRTSNTGPTYLGGSGTNGIEQVLCGNNFMAALTTGSTVYTWGDNDYGQMALSAGTSYKDLATAVSGLPSDIVALGGGGNSVFAITGSNAVYAWGQNGGGQLGIGTESAPVRTPTEITGTGGPLTNNIVQVASSVSHTLFLTSGGNVWASGSNASGELGDGNTTDSPAPVQVVLSGSAPLSGIVAVSAGKNFSVALGSNGTIYTWGLNTYGELCNGSTTNNSSDYNASTSAVLPGLGDVLPSVTLSGSVSQSIQPASILLTASGTASEGLSWVTFWENGSPISSGASFTSFLVSNLPAGSYSFWATATDDYQGTSTSETIPLIVPLPTITGSTVVPQVIVGSGTSGDFRITRNGATSSPVTVTYTVGGSAVPGVDYNALSGSITIASGSATADIFVTPISPGSAGWEKDVAITVTGTAYNIMNGAGDIVISNSEYAANNTNYWYLRGTGTSSAAYYSYVVPIDDTAGNTLYATGTGNTVGSSLIALGGYAILQPAATGSAAGGWPSGEPWFLRIASSGTEYHLATISGPDQPVYPSNMAFTNPIVAFGSQGGGRPLYTGRPYSFGIVSGGQSLNPGISGTMSDLKIDVYAASSFTSGTATSIAPIETVPVHLPRPGETDWDPFAQAGCQMPLTITASSGTNGTGTFTIDIAYASSGFGAIPPATNYPLTVSVNSNTSAYYLRISVQGAVPDPNGNWDWMAVDNPSNPSGTGDFSASFTMDFTQQGLSGWQSTIVDRPGFAGTTQVPAAYQGMSEEDLLNLSAIVTGSDSLPVSVTGTLQTAYLTTGTNIATVTSPELVDNPILDKFVTSMNNDPLALANYVQNQIGLVDTMALPNASGTISYNDQSVNFGGVNRSALGVLLEGQGSPVEQCGLLVYLLRRAGVPCAYVFGPLDQTEMLTAQLSEMLHMRLNGAEDFGVSESTTGPTLTPVNYPWVTVYINGQWVHLFPWIKDTEVDEGYDLYDYLPQGYKTGAEWMRQYLYNDPNIRTPGTEYYQNPGVLFAQFVENNLPEDMSIDDIGVTIYNRRHYYSSWSQFPHPWSRPAVSSSNLYTDLMTYSRNTFGNDNLFDTASIEVFSDRTGTGSYVSGDPMVESGTLYTALLDDRRFLLYHTPAPVSGTIPNTSGTTAWPNYNMNLSLEAATPIATGTNTVSAGTPFQDTGGDPYLLNKQFSSASLTGSDQRLYMIINQTRHRAAETPNGGYPFLGILDGSPSTDTRPLQVGDTAGICFNFGQVTHWMLEVQEDKYWQLQQQILQNPSGTYDIETAQGLPCYLMGMSYFYREGGFINQYQALTKMDVVSQVAHGLAKLSPARISGSATLVNGALNLRYPNVDMFHYDIAWAGNGTVNPGSGEANSTTWADYQPVFIAASSAQEHLTIQQFFGPENDDAISTVKLMDIGRGLSLTGTTYTTTGITPQETVSVDPRKGITVKTGTTTLCVTGSGGMIELNSENYQALGQMEISGTYYNGATVTGTTAPLSWWAIQAGIWTTATNAFASGNSPELHRVFITPGPISGAISGTGSATEAAYYGMGALIYGVYDAAAVISPDMNGAYGGDDGQEMSWSNSTFDTTYLADSSSIGGDFAPYIAFGGFGLGNGYVASMSISQETNITDFGVSADNINSIGVNLNVDIETQGAFTFADNLLDVSEGWTSGGGGASSILSESAIMANNQPLKPTIHDNYQVVDEPVNTVTGEYYADNVDLKLNGPMPLEIRRNYGSQNPFSGAFGYGWKMSMVPYLVVSTDSNQTLIYAAEMDGSVLTYRRTTPTSSTWLASGSDNPLCANPQSYAPGAPNPLNNQITASTSGTNTDYTLAGADGSVRTFQVESFPTAGGSNALTLQRPYLQKWQDNRGNYFTFSYGTDSTQVNYGQLVSIQSSNGNYAGFMYDVYGHITQAYTGDGSWTYYQYDQYGDLTQVTLNDNSVITYGYRHEPNGAGGYYSEHLLAQENKPGGRVLQNYYDYFGFRRVLFQKSTVQQGNASPIQNAAFNYVIGGLANNTPFTLSGTTYSTGTTLTLSGAPVSGGYNATLSSGTVNLTSSALLSGSTPLTLTALMTGTTTMADVNNHSWTYAFANGQFTQITTPPQNNEGTPQVISQTWASPYVTAESGVYPCSLLSQTDKRGLVTTYSYDNNGNLLQKVVTGDLKGDGNNSETAPTTYTYNSSSPVTLPGTLISIIPNTLASVTDPLGNSLSYTYGNSSYPYLPTAITRATTSGAVSTEVLQYGNASTGSDNAYGLLTQDTPASGYPDQAETAITYNGNGFPTQTTVYSETADPNIVTNYTYNLRGQVVSKTDAAGRSTQYQYDARGNTTGILTYNQSGGLVAWKFNYYNQNGEIEWTQGPRYAPDDDVQTEYDGAGRVSMVGKWLTGALATGTGVTSAGTANTYYSYDNFGNKTQVQDPKGNVTTMTYDAIGEMMTRQTPNGSHPADESFTYEPGGKVATHVNVLSGAESYSYTTNGLLMSGTLADGSTGVYQYDLTGRVTKQTLANGSYWSISYNDYSRTVTRSFYNSSGTLQGSESEICDRRGNQTSKTDFAGNTFTTAYDGLNRVKSVTGPGASSPAGAGSSAQQITYNTYDNAGVTQTGSNVLGESTVTTFDALERPTQVFTYNSGGGVASDVTYNYAANFQSVTTVKGSGSNGVAVSETQYTDTYGKPVLLVHGDGSFQATVYDVDENKVLYEDEEGNETTWSYDALNHPASETLPGGANITFTYNAAGEMLSEQMPESQTQTFSYDAAGRKTGEELSGTGGATTRNYSYSYYSSNSPSGAANGLLETVTDPRGFSTTTTYDAWMRPSTMDSSGGAIPQQNQNTSYAYDIRGMVNSVSQSYVTGTTGPSTLVTRSFDGYGNINAETVAVAGTTVSEWYQSWDGAGRRSALNFALTPLGVGAGSQYAYQYNADRLLTQVTNSATNFNFSYGDDGLLQQESSPFATQSITSRDNRSRITAENTVSGGATVINEAIGYRLDSRIATYNVNGAILASGTETRNYAYDARGRVVTEPFLNNTAGLSDLPLGMQTASYYFDQAVSGGPSQIAGLGVRTNQFVNTYAGNQVSSQDAFERSTLDTLYTGNGYYQPFTISYDADGNVVGRIESSGTTILAAQTETWDGLGRLALVSARDTGSNDYDSTEVYDGFGRRVETIWQPMTNGTASGSPSTLVYYYDPQVKYLQLGYSNNGDRNWSVYGPDRSGVYGGDQGIGGLVNEVEEYYGYANTPLNDLFGDVLGECYTYNGSQITYGYGLTLGGYGPEPATGVNSLTPEWRGLSVDWDGFYYIGARYYDFEGQTGRFLSPDPEGQGASMDLYSYCNGDPVNGLDPDGRCPDTESAAPSAGGVTASGGVSVDPATAPSQATAIGPNTTSSGSGVSPSFFGSGPGDAQYDPADLAKFSPGYQQFQAQYQYDTMSPVQKNIYNFASVGVTMLAVISSAIEPEDLVALEGFATTEPLMAGATMADSTVNAADATAVANGERVFGSSLYDSGFPNVNPNGYSINCINCAIATDATLAGHPASALICSYESLDVLQDEFGGTFQSVRGPVDIGNILSQSGNGARGIVAGTWMNGVGGHVFNVINDNGAIEFVDGQTGIDGSLHFYNMQNVRLLLTAPGTQ